MRMIWLASAIALAASAAATAQDSVGEEQPAGEEASLSADERRQLARAVQRGRALAAVAQSGLLGTRDMLARLSDADKADLEGWIVEPEGNGVEITFYGQSEGAPFAVYRAIILGNRVTTHEIFPEGSRPPLTPLQARMAAARAAASGIDRQTCNDQPFNVFILPPESLDAPIEVYHFTAQDEPGRFPIGGHFYSVVAPGGSIASSRGFSDSCLAMEVEEVAPGEKAEPIAVTHLLDPLPTEVHVFMSLWTDRPLIVTTGEPSRRWLVTGEGIGEIRDEPLADGPLLR